MQKNILIFLISIVFAFNAIAQTPCSLDNTFDTDGRLISDGSRLCDRLIALPDGSVLVAYNPFGNGHAYVRHLLVNGSIDNSYGTSGKTTIQVASLRTEIKAMLLLNNELYVCGSTGTGTNTYAFIKKLQSNGLIDATFGNQGLVEFVTYYTFNAMRFEPGTNKIMVGGMKTYNKATITRLHTSGYMDASFGNLGSTDIASANSSTYYEIRDITLDKTNKWLITGKHYTTQGSNIFTQLVVMRFDNTGLLDNTFDTDGMAYYNSAISGSYDEGTRIFADAQNEYYVSGATYTNSGSWDYSLLKIKQNGSTQNTFGSNGWKIYDLTNQVESEYLLNATMLANGNILMTGNQGSGDTVHFALLMVKPDGSRDQSFAPNGLFMNIFDVNNNSSSAGLSMTTDNKIYLSGYTRTCVGGTCGPLSSAIARYIGPKNPNSIVEYKTDNQLAIYPNPTQQHGEFSIEDYGQPIRAIQAFDLLGNQISIKVNGKNAYQLLNVQKGMYLLKINTQSGEILNKQLIVE